MNRFVLTVFALLALPVLADSETYVVEPGHSFARFGYSHLGYSTQISRFNKTSGSFTFDAAAGTGSVDITIDTTSVDTGSDIFNKHIQAEDYLFTEKFPSAHYKAEKVVFKEGKPVSVEGELTLKGVTKPVTLAVSHFHCMPHPVLKKQACGADASAMVKRTDFNMGKSVPYVGDEVTLSIAIEALKK
jgi:polyisoprenoid-binding protein YceI